MKKYLTLFLFISIAFLLFPRNQKSVVPNLKIFNFGRDGSTETEPNDSCSAIGVQTVSNGNYYGQITPGIDVDYWAFFANENDNTVISTVGFGYNLDTELWLLDCDESTILAHNDDVNPGIYQSTIYFTIPAYGKYYFIVGSYANFEGNYGVSVSGISITQNEENYVKSDQISIRTYPNPFKFNNFQNNIPLNFCLNLDNDEYFDLTIYNLKGQKINKVFSGDGKEGTNRMQWFGKNDNGKIVSSGIYFYELKLQNHSIYGKFLVTK